MASAGVPCLAGLTLGHDPPASSFSISALMCSHISPKPGLLRRRGRGRSTGMIAPSRDSGSLGHHADAIRQQHRLGDVVRDEHDRLAGLVPDLHQLALHASRGSAHRARRTARPSAGSSDRWPARGRSARAASCRPRARPDTCSPGRRDARDEGTRGRRHTVAPCGIPLHPQAERHVVDRAQPVEKGIIALKHDRAVDSRTLGSAGPARVSARRRAPGSPPSG